MNLPRTALTFPDAASHTPGSAARRQASFSHALPLPLHGTLIQGSPSLLLAQEQTTVTLNPDPFSSQSPFCWRILMTLPSADLEVGPFLLILPRTCCLDQCSRLLTSACFCP